MLLATIYRNTAASLSVVEQNIRVSSSLQSIVFDEATRIPPPGWGGAAHWSALIACVPERNRWRVYNHCAVITRAYAILEEFVDDAIGEWLAELARCEPVYAALPDTTRRHHCKGIGKMLAEFDSPRFRNLNLTATQLVAGLHAGLSAHEKYDLLPAPFLLREQNLRMQELVRLFSNVGLKDIQTWLSKHRSLRNLLDRSGDERRDLGARLNRFVQERNAAAHGAVEEILGPVELGDAVVFVRCLCEALAEFVTRNVVNLRRSKGLAHDIGEVTNVYHAANAFAVAISFGTIGVGDTVAVDGPDCCFVSRVASLQFNGAPIERSTAPEHRELGVRLDDMNVKRNYRLVSLAAGSQENATVPSHLDLGQQKENGG